MIEDRRTGWDPGKVKVEKVSRGSEKPGSSEPKSASKERAAEEKRREKCWKKRKGLEGINWKLRRGYSPVEGIKLRRKRDTYEDYIREFCN